MSSSSSSRDELRLRDCAGLRPRALTPRPPLRFLLLTMIILLSVCRWLLNRFFALKFLLAAWKEKVFV
jgi:hypothetical protein